MTVSGCPYFGVACSPSGRSCEACALRSLAAERKEARKRIEARRREWAGETAHALGKAQVGRCASTEGLNPSEDERCDALPHRRDRRVGHGAWDPGEAAPQKYRRRSSG